MVIQFSSTFRRDPKGLQELVEFCSSHQVKQVAMESTSTYWYPVYKELGKIEDLQNERCVVNASQLIVMGSHKIDVRDTELLANCRLNNTLKASFIPSPEIFPSSTTDPHTSRP
jgi:transposase